MYRTGQFLRQRLVDQAVTGDPRQAVKAAGDDINREMALATRPGAGMTGMEVTIISDRQGTGCERFLQFVLDPDCDITHFHTSLFTGFIAALQTHDHNW